MQDTGAMTKLQEELALYTALPYQDLVARINEPPLSMQLICGNEHYFAEFKVIWHDRPTGELCVSGSIHDGGWCALVPFLESRIISPSGEVRAARGV